MNATQLNEIAYSIHTETEEIAKVNGLSEALSYVNNMANRSGVAVRFVPAQGEMLMSAKFFIPWANHMKNLLAR
jgi:hypothetical protein